MWSNCKSVLIINYCKMIQRQYSPRVRRPQNPGMERSLQAFVKKDLEKSGAAVEFDIDENESDFMQIHKTAKEFEQESYKMREKMGLWIVKNKYFKKRQPNFLTWAEKEQIRLLHRQDPDEWCSEKLSSSFPADPVTIMKIVKAKWSPKTDTRIQHHDEVVKQNWAKFNRNELSDLDSQVISHLKKFSNRKLAPSAMPKRNENVVSVIANNKGNEFSNILTRYESKKEEQKRIGLDASEVTLPKASDKDSFLLNQASTEPKGHLRWRDIRTNVNYDNEDKDSLNDNNEIVNITNSDSALDFKSTKEKKSNVSSTMSYEYDSKIKEFIKIPKTLYKRGATYRINDCFYDDDGEFLYRVPGGVGNSNN